MNNKPLPAGPPDLSTVSLGWQPSRQQAERRWAKPVPDTPLTQAQQDEHVQRAREALYGKSRATTSRPVPPTPGGSFTSEGITTAEVAPPASALPSFVMRACTARGPWRFFKENEENVKQVKKGDVPGCSATELSKDQTKLQSLCTWWDTFVWPVSQG